MGIENTSLLHLAIRIRDSHGIFRDDCAVVEGGVLGSDDFSPAGGAGAEENERSEGK